MRDQVLTRRSMLLAIGALAGVAACAPAAPSPTPAAKAPATGTAPAGAAATSAAAPAKSAQPVSVAIVAPIAGNFALLGQPVRYGIELAIDDLNGKGGIGGAKVESFVEDTGANNTAATNAVQAAIAKKPVAMLGMPLSTQAFAAMQLVKEAKIPFFVSGTNRDLTRQGIPWVFNMFTNDDVSVDAAAKYAAGTLKKTKFAILHGTDEYGTGAAKYITTLAPTLGASVVADESYALSDKDMTGQITKVKNADPDIIFLWSDQATMALVIRQARQLAIQPPLICPPIIPGTVKIMEPKELEGVYSQQGSLPAKSADPVVKDFATRFKAKFNMDSDAYSAAAYDGMMMLGRAIEKGGRDTDGIVKAMLETTDYKGVYGTHSADKYGNLTQEGVIAQFRDGDWVPLESVRREPER